MACAQRHRCRATKGRRRAVSTFRAVWFGSGLVLLSAGALAAHTQQSVPETPAAAATPITYGPTAFRESGCSQCHQIRGVGGHKGPDLSGVGRRLKKDAIQKQIVQGGAAMPAFGDALPSEQIAALVKYLNHCRAKKPKVTKPAPPADAAQPSAD
jgi:mono/diheme cytochrome c family protein